MMDKNTCANILQVVVVAKVMVDQLIKGAIEAQLVKKSVGMLLKRRPVACGKSPSHGEWLAQCEAMLDTGKEQAVKSELVGVEYRRVQAAVLDTLQQISDFQIAGLFPAQFRQLLLQITQRLAGSRVAKGGDG